MQRPGQHRPAHDLPVKAPCARLITKTVLAQGVRSVSGVQRASPERSSVLSHSHAASLGPDRVASALLRSAADSSTRQCRCQAAVLEAASPSVQSASAREAPQLPFRVGHGFDLHRLEEGPYKLILGGVEIPHDRGCVAHSDGDALLHTITDAILGALSLPDIGQLFPDSDPKWKGARSDQFVREAVRLMHEAGFQLGNLDATIILQRPKLSPHKGKIIASICDILDAHPSVINIKAKTHEKVDSLGENRSIACHAVVMLIRK